MFNYCNLLVDFCANEPRDVQLKSTNRGARQVNVTGAHSGRM